MNLIFLLFVVVVIMGVGAGRLGAGTFGRRRSLYMYVGVQACMCVRLANGFINVKTEIK